MMPCSRPISFPACWTGFAKCPRTGRCSTWAGSICSPASIRRGRSGRNSSSRTTSTAPMRLRSRATCCRSSIRTCCGGTGTARTTLTITSADCTSSVSTASTARRNGWSVRRGPRATSAVGHRRTDSGGPQRRSSKTGGHPYRRRLASPSSACMAPDHRPWPKPCGTAVCGSVNPKT